VENIENFSLYRPGDADDAETHFLAHCCQF